MWVILFTNKLHSSFIFIYFENADRIRFLEVKEIWLRLISWEDQIRDDLKKKFIHKSLYNMIIWNFCRSEIMDCTISADLCNINLLQKWENQFSIVRNSRNGLASVSHGENHYVQLTCDYTNLPIWKIKFLFSLKVVLLEFLVVCIYQYQL